VQEGILKEIFSWLKIMLFAMLIAFLCQNFLFTPTTVYGESMLPTFKDHDKVFITKLSEIDRFDIIVFHAPDSEENYIKRVIGLPGDKITMEDDILYINGKAFDEHYLQVNKEIHSSLKLTGDFSLKELTGEAKVPEDSFFVLGDNRLVSKDSRSFGFISADSIIGEVKIRYYPFEDIRFIH
jgi:signal peptidase I